jgi:hypothetical protein
MPLPGRAATDAAHAFYRARFRIGIEQALARNSLAGRCRSRRIERSSPDDVPTGAAASTHEPGFSGLLHFRQNFLNEL